MPPKRGTPEYDKWRRSPKYDVYCKRISVATTGERNPNYGKHPSAETRAKMRVAQVGKHPSAETIAKIRAAKLGEQNPMYGKHPSAETRAKMGASNIDKHPSEETRVKLRVAKSGERNSNWRGGVSFEPYPTGWTMRLRDTIRERDNYTCVLCGKPQGKRRHSVHHINYTKADLCEDNLITLCRPCHRKTSHDRKYWENLFLMIYVPDFPKIRRKNESNC